MDDRRRIAVVDDLLKPDVAQPARGLAGVVHQPRPVLVVVQVGLAVRLADGTLRNDGVMQTPPMNFRGTAFQCPAQLLGNPLAVAVTGRGVETVGIDLGGEDSQVAKGEAGLVAGKLQHGAKRSAAVDR